MAGTVSRELAVAYVSIVPTMRGVKKTLTNELGPAADSAGMAAGGRLGSSMARSSATTMGKNFASGVGGVIRRSGGELYSATVAAGRGITRAASPIMSSTAAEFRRGWRTIAGGVDEVHTAVGQAGRAVGTLTKPFWSVSRGIKSGFDEAARPIGSLEGKIGQLGFKVGSLGRSAVGAGQQFVNGFRRSETASSSFVGNLSWVERKAADVGAKAGTMGRDFVTGFRNADAGASSFTGRMGTVGGAVGNLARAATAPGRNFVAGFKAAGDSTVVLEGAFQRAGGVVGRVASGIGGSFSRVFGSVSRGAADAGTSTAGGFMSGLSSLPSRAAGMFSGLFGGAVSGAGPAGTQAGNRFSSSLMQSVKSGLRGLPAMLGGVAGLMGGGAILGGGFKRLTDMERAGITFKNIGLSAEDTTGLMTGLEDAVTGTSVSLSDAARTASLLMQSGVELGDPIMESTKAMANLTAASGATAEEIGAVMTSVKSAGKLMAGDAFQLTSRGIPVWSMLAKSMNVAEDQLKKMASKGQISYEDFVTAVNQGTGSLAKEMGETLPAKMANMRTAFARLGAEVLKPLMGPMTTLVTEVTNVVKTVLVPAVGEIWKVLQPVGQFLKDTVEWWGPFAAGIGIVAGLAVVVGILAAAFTAVFTPINLVILGIGLLVGGLVLAYNKIGWFHDFVDWAWAGIKLAISTVVDWFVGTAVPWLSNAVGAVGGFFQGLWDTVGIVWTAIRDFIGGVVSAIGGFFSGLRTVVQAAWDGIKLAADRVLQWFVATLTPLFRGALTILGNVFRWLKDNVITPVWNGIRIVIAAVAAVVLTIWDGIKYAIDNWLAPAFFWFRDSVVVPVWNAIRNAIGSAWAWIRDKVFTPIMNFIRGPLASAWNWLRGLISQVWTGIRNASTAAWNWLRGSVFQPLINFIRGAVTSAWNWLRNLISQVWTGIRNASTAAWNWVRSTVFQPIINFIRGPLGSGWDWLSSKIRQVWDAVTRKLSDGWNWIRSKVFDPLTHAITKTIPDAFGQGRDAIGRMWDGVKEKVKIPVGWVLEKVLQNGIIKHFNNIAGKLGLETKLPNVWPIPGWRVGGYTGAGNPNEVAGFVHRDEHVTRSESRRKFEREHPGELDHINRYGTLSPRLEGAAAGSAVPPADVNHAHAHGPVRGLAAGGGPVGRAIWGPVQRRMTETGRVYVSKRGALGIDGEKVARAWMGRSALDVRAGEGDPQLNIGTGTRGPWGFYSAGANANTLEVNPNGPPTARLKQAVAIHEMGHALSMQHASSSGSIMHPSLGGNTWPTEMDYSVLRSVFGNPGEGVKTYDEQGAGGWALNLIKKLVNFDGLMAKVPGAGMALDLVKGFAKKIWDGVISTITGADGGDDEGGGAERWRGTVREALAHVGLPTTSNYVDAWVRQIQTESGGNPRAVQGNIGDVNNATGDLGKGLVQVIGSTFAAYRDKSLPNDQFHPKANLVAGMNWAKARYGVSGILDVIGHGHGYRRGGRVTRPSSTFARSIRAAVGLWDDPVGSIQTLAPGANIVYNGTGRREHFKRVESPADVGGRGGVHVGQIVAADPAEAVRALQKHERRAAYLYS